MNTKEKISMGMWSVDEFGALLTGAAAVADPGSRIAFLSGPFLGTHYRENTLIGGPADEEIFVIDFEGLDCFTFVDYLEAMRLSASFEEFRDNLKRVRYRGGIVSFSNRNHFFTDWREFNRESVEDVTEEVGLGETKTVRKVLNMKDEGTFFIEGITPAEREIKYIASSSVGEDIITRLKTGDYIGIYSDLAGLDVSHVGIFIENGERPVLRHASSKKDVMKVVDQDFLDYIENKPGIVVLRAI